MVFTDSHVFTRIVYGSPLADDDIAGFGKLTPEKFYAEAFAFRFASVPRATYSFLVCHFCVSLIRLSDNLFDLDLSQELTVSVLYPVSFSSPLLENDHFVVFQVFEDFDAY